MPCHAAAAVHPILFEIAGYAVPSYGVALAIAFTVGLVLAQRRARAAGLDERYVLDLWLIALIASLVGARLLWVATHLDAFTAAGGRFGDAVNPFGARAGGVAGLSMSGGVLLALAAGLAYLAWRRVPILPTADALAPLVILGEGITRIGCFLHGCCYGRPCEAWFCLHFPPGSGAHGAFAEQAVHATQLYASALGFAGFLALSALWRRRPAAGTVFFAFLVWIGGQRVVLDLWRAHDPGTLWLVAGGTGIAASSVLSAALVVAGIAGLLLRRWAGGAERRGHA
jgi:phosphatidylglycerol---prolipoprotein diacylglyceryl transferase